MRDGGDRGSYVPSSHSGRAAHGTLRAMRTYAQPPIARLSWFSYFFCQAAMMEGRTVDEPVGHCFVGFEHFDELLDLLHDFPQ